MQPVPKKITIKKAKELAKIYKINLKNVPLKEWNGGLNIELEHRNIVKSIDTLVKIAIAHLSEDNRYYKFLEELEKKRSKIRHKNIFV